MNTLSRAITAVGSSAELARRISASPQQVYEWRTGKRKIPPARCHDIEAATDGAVTCEQLRPDLEWHALPDGRKVSSGPKAKPARKRKAA